jgi:hypothetical protein
VDRSHRRGVPHKTNLADSADSARNVNDLLTVRLVCTKIPYQSIYGTLLVKILEPSICVDYSKHRNGDPIPPEITVAIGIRFMTGLLQDVHSTSI